MLYSVTPCFPRHFALGTQHIWRGSRTDGNGPGGKVRVLMALMVLKAAGGSVMNK